MIKLHLIGRLTADPVQNTVNGNNVVNFSVAANTKRKDGDGKYIANFFRCAVWRQQGENCMKYLHKGDRVGIEGDLELTSYTDNKGNQRYDMQVTANDVEFLSDKRSAEATPAAAPAATGTNTEDELPF